MATLGVAACRCRGPSPSVALAPSLLRAPTSAPGGSLAAQSARARALFLAAGKAPRLRSSRAGGQARAGLPIISSVPVIGGIVNFALNPVLLFMIYTAGAARFWSGFPRTNYTSSTTTRSALTAAWPVLFIASKAFRDNFKKAVK
eukprot:SM000090S24313  [mRNA]  locus=s90:248278:249595:- [translate_table: standard]